MSLWNEAYDTMNTIESRYEVDSLPLVSSCSSLRSRRSWPSVKSCPRSITKASTRTTAAAKREREARFPTWKRALSLGTGLRPTQSLLCILHCVLGACHRPVSAVDATLAGFERIQGWACDSCRLASEAQTVTEPPLQGSLRKPYWPIHSRVLRSSDVLQEFQPLARTNSSVLTKWCSA